MSVCCLTTVAPLAAARLELVRPVEAQVDIVAEFKYGAVGTEERAGIPYWI
jgi:hypothetical protein